MDTFFQIQTHVAFLVSLFLFRFVTAMDSLAPSQFLSDGGGSTLVSKNGIFELGFFSPGVSKNRYLGIWYKDLQVPTSVWIANRNNPINDSSGILVMNKTGNVILLSHNTSVVWSVRLLRKVSINPKLQLLDTGNLVLRDEENPDEFPWQSFDYPTDTFLPGMKLGWDFRNQIERNISSWKNPNDPSTGDLTLRIEHFEFPEPVMWKGSKMFVRSGPWNGIRFSGKSEISMQEIQVKFLSNEDEISYQYFIKDKSKIIMSKLNQTTNTRTVYMRSVAERNWLIFPASPIDRCDDYGLCGVYGYCDIRNSSDVCKCLEGFKFKPKYGDHGCERNTPLNCSDDGVGFSVFSQMKLPDTRDSWVNRSMNLEECREKCRRNCSCMAFANTDISGSGSGCAIWFGDLIDLRFIPDAGQDLYVRMQTSGSAKDEKAEGKLNPKVKIGIVIGIGTSLILAILLAGLRIYKKRSNSEDSREKLEAKDLELPFFELSLINRATNNFSMNNKLGEGGFGPVYKGKLENGQDIAVKRLSKSSGQGMNEFENEVILIAKLQHRNLVRLLGCCVQGEEKMLIYEYMPNKSLDFFIFDQTRRQLLDWSKRYHIICGIARGLVYLHQDSRLRIIHRDLKASNVLLDVDLNPKISDFGLAKTCGGDQIEGNTERVVGTFGYMAPEYAFDGQFSTKSDVFSYGILLLEIISGKRNRGFRHLNERNLIGYVWQLWKEGNPEEIIDESIKETCNFPETLRCIHISLLCVQRHPNNRPTMSSVVMMLCCEIPLPQPIQPGFFMEEEVNKMDFDSNNDQSTSTNELTITLPQPR